MGLGLEKKGRAVRAGRVAAALCAASATLAAQQVALTCNPPAPTDVEMVSLDWTGAQTQTCAGCKNNSHPTMSFDGRVITWSSDADGVLPTAPNPGNSSQIYARSLSWAQPILLSPGMTPGTIADSACDFPSISGDGKSVVFASAATNLVPGDTNARADIFQATLLPFSMRRVNELPGGGQFDEDCSAPFPSQDGRWVAFLTAATNVAPLFAPQRQPAPSTLGTTQALVKFAGRPSFEVVSLGIGNVAPDGDALEVRLDASGRLVVFSSTATNLGFNDTNSAVPDLFVRNRRTNVLSLVTSAHLQPGVTCNGASRRPSFSADGRFVAFESIADDLLPPGEDTNGKYDIFVRDLRTWGIVRVSIGLNGVDADNGSGYAAISGDGRFVMYTSNALNLTPGTTGGFLKCFLYDRDADGDHIYDESGAVCTRMISASSAGVQTNARSGGNGALSLDGRFAVFMSEGDTLVPNDFNGGVPGSGCGPICLFGRDVFRTTHF